MSSKNTLTLVNPQNGNLAFKIFSFEDNTFFDHVQRNNYYSLIWVTAGSGILRADFSEHTFSGGLLFAFSPYQPFMMIPDEGVKGRVLQFHPDFFCIHKHHEQVACNGVLFNNIYQPPFVALDADAEEKLHSLIAQMRDEMQNPALAQVELLISYLKIFLITASRLKADQQKRILAIPDSRLFCNRSKRPLKPTTKKSTRPVTMQQS
jgi:AraC family transcriptional regulator, transcriptional activator of pobA